MAAYTVCMNLTQFLIQTGVTFVAASLGALFGASLTRRTERFKHLQEMRSSAYADFLRGFARVGRAQSDTMRDERSMHEELEGRVIVTDSRSRIVIYGGKDVVHALSRFISLGTQTHTPEGMQAFTELCMLMRPEAGKERASFDDISRVLFS
ncbi:MAG TPA: hypothetical protein VEF05_00855 [Terriglobales bacterium]|nr:hypothetical protein [Terriglobales bacterium]